MKKPRSIHSFLRNAYVLELYTLTTIFLRGFSLKPEIRSVISIPKLCYLNSSKLMPLLTLPFLFYSPAWI